MELDRVVFRTAVKQAFLVTTVAGIAAGAFFGGRALISLANPSEPQPPSSSPKIVNPGGTLRDPGPYFEGVVNDINVVPVGKAEPSDFQCAGKAENAAYEVTVGTVWEISPTYLPAGAVEYGQGYVPHPVEDDFVPASLCGGEIIRSFRWYEYHGDDGAWVELSISKLGTRTIEQDVSAGRISGTTINGKPAVLIAPSPGDDLALDARVIVVEEFGQTRVSGIGLSFDQLVKVADGLNR